MGFRIIGDAGELVFDPRFLKIQGFFLETCLSLEDDLCLLLAGSGNVGYKLSYDGVVTLGERYLHLSWRHLQFWDKKRCIPTGRVSRLEGILFPADLERLSLDLPAFGVKRVTSEFP